jgi:hypothetical protein
MRGSMRRFVGFAVVMAACGIVMAWGGGKGGEEPMSFKDDVAPVIRKHCLPCHAEDNFNPSELSLDSYKSVMEGGKHGSSVVPGKGAESILVQKLGGTPPFGDPMPLDPKRKKGAPQTKKLSDVEIKIILDWIDQGARDN